MFGEGERGMGRRGGGGGGGVRGEIHLLTVSKFCAKISQ
jgi:hypothetical protein